VLHTRASVTTQHNTAQSYRALWPDFPKTAQNGNEKEVTPAQRDRLQATAFLGTTILDPRCHEHHGSPPSPLPPSGRTPEGPLLSVSPRPPPHPPATCSRSRGEGDGASPPTDGFISLLPLTSPPRCLCGGGLPSPGPAHRDRGRASAAL